MIWITLIWIACLAANFGIWYAFSRWWLKDDFVIIIGDNIKRFMKTMFVATIVAFLLCSVKIYKMSDCQIDGWITNASTQYSWKMDECQAKNAQGVYVDIKRTRGNPGDDNHSTDAQ
jgi:hypothetical protein